MNRRAREILAILADPIWQEGDFDEAPDLVCERGVCYFGAERVRRKTVDDLLRCTAISLSSEHGDRFERYVINATGRAIARRPALSYEVEATIRERRGSFSIIDDQVVPI